MVTSKLVGVLLLILASSQSKDLTEPNIDKLSTATSKNLGNGTAKIESRFFGLDGIMGQLFPGAGNSGLNQGHQGGSATPNNPGGMGFPANSQFYPGGNIQNTNPQVPADPSVLDDAKQFPHQNNNGMQQQYPNQGGFGTFPQNQYPNQGNGASQMPYPSQGNLGGPTQMPYPSQGSYGGQTEMPYPNQGNFGGQTQMPYPNQGNFGGQMPYPGQGNGFPQIQNPNQGTGGPSQMQYPSQVNNGMQYPNQNGFGSSPQMQYPNQGNFGGQTQMPYPGQGNFGGTTPMPYPNQGNPQMAYPNGNINNGMPQNQGNFGQQYPTGGSGFENQNNQNNGPEQGGDGTVDSLLPDGPTYPDLPSDASNSQMPSETEGQSATAILGKPVVIAPDANPGDRIVFPRSPDTPSQRQCVQDCETTSEYNPVCGTNNITYINPGKFVCARNCGVEVYVMRRGRCPTDPNPINVLPTTRPLVI